MSDEPKVINTFNRLMIVSEDGHKTLWCAKYNGFFSDLRAFCIERCGAKEYARLMEYIDDNTLYSCGDAATGPLVVATEPDIPDEMARVVREEMDRLTSLAAWGPGLATILNLRDKKELVEWSDDECRDLLFFFRKLDNLVESEALRLAEQPSWTLQNEIEHCSLVDWHLILKRFQEGLTWCITEKQKALVGFFTGPQPQQTTEEKETQEAILEAIDALEETKRKRKREQKTVQEIDAVKTPRRSTQVKRRKFNHNAASGDE